MPYTKIIFLTDNTNGIEENLKDTMTDLKATMESEFSKVNNATQKLKGNLFAILSHYSFEITYTIN